MDFYKHDQSDNIIYLPINKIGISTPIINAVKSKGSCVKDNHIIDYSSPQFGKLNRLDDFDFLNDTLPPVKLQHRGDYYSILDGRHRIALSIINGKTHVPAILF